MWLDKEIAKESSSTLLKTLSSQGDYGLTKAAPCEEQHQSLNIVGKKGEQTSLK